MNYIDTQYLGAQGVFAAILISGCAVWLYNKLMQRNFTIKLPDSVPPAVAQSFSSLIPGSITLGVFIILTGISTACTGKTMPALFLSILQAPAFQRLTPLPLYHNLLGVCFNGLVFTQHQFGVPSSG